MRDALAVTPLAAAVMIELPMATPVAKPLLLMVATPGVSELHVTVPETSPVLPLA